MPKSTFAEWSGIKKLKSKSSKIKRITKINVSLQNNHEPEIEDISKVTNITNNTRKILAKKQQQCSKCKEEFSTKSELFRHNQTVHRKCHTCDIEFSDQKSLNAHLEEFHANFWQKYFLKAPSTLHMKTYCA